MHWQNFGVRNRFEHQHRSCNILIKKMSRDDDISYLDIRLISMFIKNLLFIKLLLFSCPATQNLKYHIVQYK